MAFGKKKTEQMTKILETALDGQDADILVVSKKECRILFMNEAAKARLSATGGRGGTRMTLCSSGYALLFPGLCKKCPNRESNPAEGPAAYDIEDEDGRSFSLVCNPMTWIDGTPAVVLSLRDVEDARHATEKLYSLAYIDQLTSVPNRAKFKEDFEAAAGQIAQGALCGVVAMFDLDNFKAVNDTYGHNAGDLMLRRLTEHLSTNPAFEGHLYRLGGDEFVLFYAEPPGAHDSGSAFVEHYKHLLSSALMTYTMPNIDAACTLSMGVSLFPQHGDHASELLRKADIALYEAKAAGRNQLIFFEDRYDTAKKFKDLYVNIRAVLTASGRTYGYELIDSGEDSERGPSTVSLTEFNRTLDALGLEDMENDARYFIAGSNQLMSEAVLKNLPKNKFIIEIHAGDMSEAELSQYRELKKRGYTLALTGMRGDRTNPDLMFLADFCRFEPGTTPGAIQKRVIEDYPDKQFIATDVDTAAQFHEAKDNGFKFFQGFFFNSPPETRNTKEIDPLKINYFRLLQLSSAEGYVDFNEISDIISSDVALSYKLLRLLNSAALGLRYRMSSIKMAVAYLGEENLKQWIALLALRGLGSDKPLELVRLSLIRAKFGEQLAPMFIPRRSPRHVFLTGLFSLLHIALDVPKEELLNNIPLAEDIKESLLTKNGVYSDLLTFFSSYEYANWDEVSRYVSDNRLDSQAVNDAYIASVKWYNDLVNET
ncbi:diguanylate cyclase [Oscillospiraceae bacterium OttesenSCG-928-F05]|nr:diguanylate cyclase [Oscillospiraceae bacterium OttesenSCG-928-F05]